MAEQRILELGEGRLLEVSKPVANWGEAAEVLQDLKDTLAAFRRGHGFGRGISAVQIGRMVRVIYLEVDGREYELVNPGYVRRSEETFELWDDCFSFPDLLARVRRHCAVELRYQGRGGEWKRLRAEGALAELVQHEMDHLDGILAVHRAELGGLATRGAWARGEVQGKA